jgi:hypothetical protein
VFGRIGSWSPCLRLGKAFSAKQSAVERSVIAGRKKFADEKFIVHEKKKKFCRPFLLIPKWPF